MNRICALKLRAFAKLNLYLDITGRREDGYHTLETVMQSISLGDEVTVAACPGDGITLTCSREDIPTDSRNTAYRAAELFMRASGETGGVLLDIQKNIPSGAGMGGGSADAAAVLRGLNRLFGEPLSERQLLDIAVQVGADVPFCLVGGTKLCRGIGEQMSDFPAAKGIFVVVKPDFGCPTGEAYKKYDSSPIPPRGGLEGFRAAMPEKYAPEMYNVFQQLYADERIEEICRRLVELGARGAMLTGSGSAVFGVFDDIHAARAAQKKFSMSWVCGAADEGVIL